MVQLRMEVKDAVRLAKTHIVDLFGDEGVSNLGLEEVLYDDTEAIWRVTVGFSRPWDRAYGGITASLVSAGFDPGPRRSYKVVEIRDDSGRVLSVKNRESPK